MGNRVGRPRKPDEVKKAQGTFQQCRSSKAPPPIKRVDEPAPPPAHFNEPAYAKALEYWYYYEPLARKIKVLAETDLKSLEQLCEVNMRYRNAMAEYDGTCLTTNDKGNIVLNPLAKQLNELTSLHVRLLCEFGFTPSSRTRVEQVKAPKADADNPLAKILALKAKL
jgi:P27 family predicted phage terminase small subunit